MNTDEFREIALSLPAVVEKSHMDHPDFRVNEKIFATLGYPDENWAMVKLTRDEQKAFVLDTSGAFVPVKGVWGKQGCTNVRLEAVDTSTAKRAIASAWSNIAAKRQASTRK